MMHQHPPSIRPSNDIWIIGLMECMLIKGI